MVRVLGIEPSEDGLYNYVFDLDGRKLLIPHDLEVKLPVSLLNDIKAGVIRWRNNRPMPVWFSRDGYFMFGVTSIGELQLQVRIGEDKRWETSPFLAKADEVKELVQFLADNFLLGCSLASVSDAITTNEGEQNDERRSVIEVKVLHR